MATRVLMSGFGALALFTSSACIGGFAVRAAGYDRRTMDIDLLIDAEKDNEARVIDALAMLPDHAVPLLRLHVLPTRLHVLPPFTRTAPTAS